MNHTNDLTWPRRAGTPQQKVRCIHQLIHYPLAWHGFRGPGFLPEVLTVPEDTEAPTHTADSLSHQGKRIGMDLVGQDWHVRRRADS